jgi:hypothetical protein
MAIEVHHELAGCEGFRVESPHGLLGWVEETWIGPGGEPAALAVRTIDGRDGLLLAEDVDLVVAESELLLIHSGTRLLELEPPRVEGLTGNGLAASWRTTGEVLEPPDPPGALNRALLSIRPWRLAPPRRADADPSFWQALVGLYVALAVIVGLMIGLCFLIARLVSGNAV